ncbi:uncharacterized protein LOC113140477 [Mastacembelus armatus]|uniref:uncharacterized protein LOC113140477 n=1 Tax=Mastacembelus armatus TaxID=205130 RepID=UPI000E462D82|nr:uncharacterized protein LOC113140477 [Mastacembelus armatus]
MKTKLAYVLIFIQFFEACAELIFRQLKQSQTLELSCSPQQGNLMGLTLHHRGAQSQTTLLSVAKGSDLRVNPEHRGRLQLKGGLDSPQVNVTISQLHHSDTGLYMWEMSYRNQESSDLILSAQKVFLFVEEGMQCRCSPSYLPLLLAIFVAAGILLLTLSCLATEICVWHHHRPKPPVPIYEEMTRKQQSDGIPENNPEAPSHLEEVSFPVYANPNILHPQDDYYASPRQLAIRA